MKPFWGTPHFSLRKHCINQLTTNWDLDKGTLHLWFGAGVASRIDFARCSSKYMVDHWLGAYTTTTSWAIAMANPNRIKQDPSSTRIIKRMHSSALLDRKKMKLPVDSYDSCDVIPQNPHSIHPFWTHRYNSDLLLQSNPTTTTPDHIDG